MPAWWRSSEAALVADARAAVEWLVYERGVAPHRIVLWGHGVGSGVAASLAREWSDPSYTPRVASSAARSSYGGMPGGDAEAAGGDLGGVVVESGFSSLADRGADHPWLAMGCNWLPGCQAMLHRAASHSPFELATVDHVAALVKLEANTPVRCEKKSREPYLQQRTPIHSRAAQKVWTIFKNCVCVPAFVRVLMRISLLLVLSTLFLYCCILLLLL
jgi:dienelactone hydrolase